MKELLEAVSAMQAKRGLSDHLLSKRLGIDPATWSKIKNGLANPGGKVLSALLTEFPESEVSTAVIKYMQTKKTAPEPAQAGGK